MSKLAIGCIILLIMLFGCTGGSESPLRITSQTSYTPQLAERIVQYVYQDKSLAGVSIHMIRLNPILSRMKTRQAQLAVFLKSGAIGLTRNGMIGAIKTPDRDLAALLAEENHDRTELYRMITFELGRYETGDQGYWWTYLRASFGDAWIDQAPSGWWFETNNGRWAQK